MMGGLGGQGLWQSPATPLGYPRLDFLEGTAAASVLVDRVTVDWTGGKWPWEGSSADCSFLSTSCGTCCPSLCL